MSEYVDEAVRRAKPAMDDPDVNPVAWGLAMAKLPISVRYEPDNEMAPFVIETPTGRIRCSGHLENVTRQYIYTRQLMAVQP